ncbi:MAG TPA: hypothetical protein VNI77_09590 [Nitrososphaera sp.]|nr:hypothetical protein [Nitrososphaera sp.]
MQPDSAGWRRPKEMSRAAVSRDTTTFISYQSSVPFGVLRSIRGYSVSVFMLALCQWHDFIDSYDNRTWKSDLFAGGIQNGDVCDWPASAVPVWFPWGDTRSA